MKPISVPWFGPDDYEALLKMIPKGDKPPVSYEQWMNNTFLDEARMRSSIGLQPHRIYINPVAFKAWLDSKGYDASRERIGQFAAEVHRKIFDLPDEGTVVFDSTKLDR